MSHMSYSNLTQINNAVKRINDYIHETPVMQSNVINTLVNRNVYFKCEHLQKTGSFKLRGALNNILCKLENQNINGVVTHSSGNHGQATAYAAKLLNIPAIIVVPKSTPQIKCEAIKFYGAKIFFSEDTPQSREELCYKLAKENGYTIIHPYDDYDTINGQGTLGVEFLKQVPNLDAVLISVSGGGLAAGCSVALKNLNPKIRVYCVEPFGKELEESLRAGRRLWKGEQKCLDTVAEGLKVHQPGQLTFPILCDLAEQNIFSVTNPEMIDGVKKSMKYLKQVIEHAAGAAVAALFKYNKVIPVECENIGIILCGGNINVDSLL
uniref:L-serine ammonia-lyase n=1 Tax=Dugesia japonica TaxID=6161 RepID=A0A0U5BNA5_DUGJA|nr:serine racemase [Dugesia japonica]